MRIWSRIRIQAILVGGPKGSVGQDEARPICMVGPKSGPSDAIWPRIRLPLSFLSLSLYLFTPMEHCSVVNNSNNNIRNQFVRSTGLGSHPRDDPLHATAYTYNGLPYLTLPCTCLVSCVFVGALSVAFSLVGQCVLNSFVLVSSTHIC